MKKRRMYLVNTILWYIISAIWTFTFVMRITDDEQSFFLIFITGFTLLASLTCAIINHRNYLKEKNHPTDEPQSK